MDDKEAFDLVLANAVAGKYPNWTNEQRCELMQVQLPASGYRTDLEKLHADMLAEIETLRTQLAHWKTFAVHAEGEHAAWKKTAQELDAELRALRTDLDDYLRHVIDMAQGQHYLDVVRLNAEALLKRLASVLGPNAEVTGKPRTGAPRT